VTAGKLSLLVKRESCESKGLESWEIALAVIAIILTVVFTILGVIYFRHRRLERLREVVKKDAVKRATESRIRTMSAKGSAEIL